MSVFDDLVGQQVAVETLRAAVHDAGGPTLAGGRAMTQAWLFTGPPGSGRSNAARAFAAALVCQTNGCGECTACHTALIGTHSDVNLVVTETLSIGVEVARDLVLEAATAPSVGAWRVIVIEDADRLTDQANNALLKSIEEPTPHTVWLLCAPSLDDVLPTIRSRTRHVSLVTPSVKDVADYLVRTSSVDPAIASFAARASQGHIGRARGLATSESARLNRAETLRIPLRVVDLGTCLTTARDLVDAATDRAEERTKDADAVERSELARGLGVDNPQRVPKWAAPQFKELGKVQKKRAGRAVRDEIDRDLLDLASFYRDVFVVQAGADVQLVNAELSGEVEKVATRGAAESTLRSMEAILRARERIEASVAPLLAIEELMLTLRVG
ncbi:MAG TPA: DNA polymerase III subunit delta' [Actinomycetes bacterium]|nr:DNA polymerase III subunit delta' [Actinomycetes bacterium]